MTYFSCRHVGISDVCDLLFLQGAVQSVYRCLHKETGGKICFCSLEVTTGGKSSEPSPVGSLALVLHTSPGVHNEIHDTQKPSEALPGQVFQVVLKVIKGQRAGKGRILFSDQTTKGTMEAQRAQCPSVEA